MKKRYRIILFIISVFSIGRVFAYDAKIDFSGAVAATPCVVDGDNSVDVNLGNVLTSTLDTTIVSPLVAFNFKLKSCPVSINMATAVFIGTVSQYAAGLWKNDGSASNISVQIANADTGLMVTAIAPNVTVNVQSDRSATFNLLARMYATDRTSVPGTVNTVLQVSFTYQ
ncbi:fimbrial protein [Klebsiella sp. I138]|uniref:fimbrial protein n=1 Tax=Klebsiella sp. I138 TaxID=2755385 RepID=UPI003DA92FFD